MAADRLALDHIVLMIEPDGPEPAALDRLGLRESYRRAHPGQGTANVCYCFDNAYLELLWQTDAAEIAAPPALRTRLKERVRWRHNGASPFGISLRGTAPLPFEVWQYRPVYLPDGMSIPIAMDSEHPGHPLIFRSPGDSRPDAWTDGRAGQRQTGTGLTEIIGLHLETPVAAGIPPSLRALDTQGLLTVEAGRRHRLVLNIAQAAGGARQLVLPGCAWG